MAETKSDAFAELLRQGLFVRAERKSDALAKLFEKALVRFTPEEKKAMSGLPVDAVLQICMEERLVFFVDGVAMNGGSVEESKSNWEGVELLLGASDAVGIFVDFEKTFFWEGEVEYARGAWVWSNSGMQERHYDTWKSSWVPGKIARLEKFFELRRWYELGNNKVVVVFVHGSGEEADEDYRGRCKSSIPRGGSVPFTSVELDVENFGVVRLLGLLRLGFRFEKEDAWSPRVWPWRD